MSGCIAAGKKYSLALAGYNDIDIGGYFVGVEVVAKEHFLSTAMQPLI
jgi:hypothetical protein